MVTAVQDTVGKCHQPMALGSWLLSPTGRGTLELDFWGTQVGLGLGEHPGAISRAVGPVSGCIHTCCWGTAGWRLSPTFWADGELCVCPQCSHAGFVSPVCICGSSFPFFRAILVAACVPIYQHVANTALCPWLSG